MTAFERALKFTLRWEGGYSNHPSDPGGETYRGITRKNHGDWPGWEIIDRIKPPSGQVIDDPELEVAIGEFYRDEYWDKAKCDQIAKVAPQSAGAVFDMAVHSGCHNAIMQLQNEIGAKMDGAFGPKSTFAMLDHMDRFLARGHVDKRTKFLNRLVARRPSLKVFQKGWQNRMDAMIKFIQRGG